MTIRYPASEAGALIDDDLDAVVGGGILDTIVGVVTTIWRAATSPAPSGVKGEATERRSDWIM